ncbi:MAG: hypothetical protein KC422_03135 [Trueperaceae bacterium]|nr:hypothetical protein [Trueperaceae bacterium]
MATIIIDQMGEYIWQVDDDILKHVIDHVMRHIEARSAFHELLYASRTYGNLAFYQLGPEQKDRFEALINDFAQANPDLGEEEQKTVKKLIDMIAFSRNFDTAAV